MPKYQIILSSNSILTDQEIQNISKTLFNTWIVDKFEVIYAQNLEGIKKELWEKKNELEASIDKTGSSYHVEDSFEDIKKLFKLDS